MNAHSIVNHQINIGKFNKNKKSKTIFTLYVNCSKNFTKWWHKSKRYVEKLHEIVKQNNNITTAAGDIVFLHLNIFYRKQIDVIIQIYDGHIDIQFYRNNIWQCFSQLVTSHFMCCHTTFGYAPVYLKIHGIEKVCEEKCNFYSIGCWNWNSNFFFIWFFMCHDWVCIVSSNHVRLFWKANVTQCK